MQKIYFKKKYLTSEICFFNFASDEFNKNINSLLLKLLILDVIIFLRQTDTFPSGSKGKDPSNNASDHRITATLQIALPSFLNK